ncbi:MAG: RadC family protein [Formosimonas sp.]
MPITDWPLELRPREKLLARGAAHLSDAELLAIFLRVGMVGKSAVDLANELIAHFGTLSRLFQANIDDLAAIKGMGQAKYVQLQAVLEMSRRALKDSLSQAPSFNHVEALKTFIQLQFTGLQHETLMVLFFHPNLSLIGIETVAQGDSSQVALPTRLIAQRALNQNAHGIILAHNHPHGEPSPSASDLYSTRLLQQHLKPLNIHLLDHFIICDGHAAYSMAEHKCIHTE